MSSSAYTLTENVDLFPLADSVHACVCMCQFDIKSKYRSYSIHTRVPTVRRSRSTCAYTRLWKWVSGTRRRHSSVHARVHKAYRTIIHTHAMMCTCAAQRKCMHCITHPREHHHRATDGARVRVRLCVCVCFLGTPICCWVPGSRAQPPIHALHWLCQTARVERVRDSTTALRSR